MADTDTEVLNAVCAQVVSTGKSSHPPHEIAADLIRTAQITNTQKRWSNIYQTVGTYYNCCHVVDRFVGEGIDPFERARDHYERVGMDDITVSREWYDAYKEEYV